MSCKKNFCKLLWLEAPTCKAAYMTRNYYVIEHTLHMSMFFWRTWIILASQGDVLIPCRRQREMEKNIKTAVVWNISTCLWYHITEDSYLHGHCCDSHKSHIDHGHLAFFVYLSFPVNLPVVTLWAVHARCSINKAKCRIWENINSKFSPLFFPLPLLFSFPHACHTAVLHTIIP